jgi:3-isopropylmalate dehydratase small subunit
MRICDDAKKSSKIFYENKIKREQNVVECEYDFWQCIDAMAKMDDEIEKENKQVKKLNNGNYKSSYSPFMHYPSEIKNRLKKIDKKNI